MKHAIAMCLALAFLGAAQAAPLIKEDEAKLPAASEPEKTRGITRGPAIKVVSPDPAAQAVKSPFNFKVAFEPRGGAKIDPASVKVTYLKTPSVDLLDRIKPGLSEKGIDLAGAEAPVGEHQIRVTVRDSEGRESKTDINFKVAK
jgi:hypothetical protein